MPTETKKINATLNRAANPLSIFKWRNFALLWSSTTLVAGGTQMEAVVLGWYILTLTDSPFLVGLIAATRMALNFLALFAGAIADRLPRHRLLASVEFMMTCLGLLMLTLIITDVLEVWHIFGITLAAGLIRIFQMPAAQSLIADTLPEERVGNGVAFNTVGMNLAMIVGPLIGGILFKAFGPEGAYVVIASLYCTSGLASLSIKIARTASSKQREPVLRSMLEALRYVKGNQVIWAALLLAVMINFSGWTFHTALMPIFARDVLETDSAGLGLLLFAFGIGALIGSGVLAITGSPRRVGRLLIGAAILWHFSILVFATSETFYISIAILVFTGMCFSSVQVLMLTLLLRTTQAEFRGRVMGLRVFAILAYTFGSITAGAIAGQWGAAWSANTVGIVGITLIVLVASFTPKLRQA